MAAWAQAVADGIPVNGLIANVRFSDQKGTISADTTGNGNDCTFGTGVNSPTWNGIGIGLGKSNDGGSVNQWCSLPATLAPQARSVAVCAYLPAQVEMSLLNDAIHGHAGGLAIPTLLGAQNRDGLTLSLNTPVLGTQRIYYQQSTDYGFGGNGSGTNDMSIGWNCFFYVLGSSADKPATVDSLYRNGVEVSSYAIDHASADFLADTGIWYVGGGGYSTSLQFVGTIEHVLVWNRMLSAAEVASSWTTLQAEMIARGVDFSPATNQSSDSQAVCLGDSQTSGGVGDAYTWCRSTNLTLPPNSTWDITNNGEQGTTCVSMESGIPQEEALNWSPNAPHTALMIYCGINDITVAEETPAEIWARQLAMCKLAKNAGYENVLDITLPSWVDQDTNVEALNALIRQNWKSCFTGVADMANDPRLGAAGAYSNPTYFQQDEPSHLTSAGETVLGGYVSNVLGSLYGNTSSTPTIVSQSSYTMAAADNYVKALTANSSITLPSCLGYVQGSSRVLTNASSGPVTVLTQNSELLDGSAAPATVPAGVSATASVELLSPTAAGCAWHDPATTIALTATPAPAVSGQQVTLTAKISSADGTTVGLGIVSFACNGLSLGSASVTSGAASITQSSAGLPAGTYGCTASFSDSTGLYAASAGSAAVKLNDQTSRVSLSTTPAEPVANEPVTLTATITGQYATPVGGSVTFSARGVELGKAAVGSNGMASIQMDAAVPPGTYSVEAVYSGTTGTTGSTGTSEVTVVPASN